jgi:hypothetical protein
MTAQLFAQDPLIRTTELRSLGERTMRLKRFASLFGEEFPNCINRLMIQVVKCFGVDIYIYIWLTERYHQVLSMTKNRIESTLFTFAERENSRKKIFSPEYSIMQMFPTPRSLSSALLGIRIERSD